MASEFTQLEMAQKRLFDKDGLAATNVGITRGTCRDTTPEQAAEQVNRALSQLAAGDFEEAVLD